MKRFIAFMLVVVCLVPPVAYSATEIRMLGGPGANNQGDILLGTGYLDSAGGRRIYRINADMIPFSQDNAIKLGNANLYGISAGVAQHWGIPYFDGSGNLNWLGMGLSGYCLKFQGTTSPPTVGTCGGGGSGGYDPAAVAITGGTLNNVYIGYDGNGIAYMGAVKIGGYDAYVEFSPDKDLRFFGGDSDYRIRGDQFTTNERGLYYDPIWAFIVNNEGTGLIDNTTVFGIYDNSVFTLPPLMKVDEDGIVTAKAGLATSVANGYRRMNICNTGGIGAILFTPQAGDITCADNLVYIYASGEWKQFSMGTETGGGVTKMLVTDNFNRANADPAGTPWVQLDNNASTIRIVSNEAGAGTGGGVAYYGDNTFSSNQYAEVKITSAVTVAENGGPVVRAQNSSGGNAYVFFVTDASTAKMFKVITGTWTQLGANCSGTFAQNDVMRLEASGSTLTPKQNGSALSGCDRTDTDLTGGRPGIYIDGADWRLDDFEGGDL